jgi:hypothetical protein
MNTELTHTDTPRQLAVDQTNPIGPMLNAIIANGITAESVEALERLANLYQRTEEQRAAKAFAAGFAAVQSEMPSVQATRAVPGNGGEVRYTFAPFDEIMRTVQPILARHGFSVSFDSRMEEGRTVALCTLTHASGHSRTNQFAVRGGKGPPGTNEAQADGSARSYARRYALCDALNISIDHDTDARSEGDTITPDVAARLERDANAAGIDTAKLLRLASAESFDTITTAKVPIVERAIEDRKRAARPASAPATATAGDFADAGQWKEAMVAEFARRKAKNPEAAFAASLAKGGYTSYLDVPPFRRGVAWDALKGGKLDAYLVQA